MKKISFKTLAMVIVFMTIGITTIYAQKNDLPNVVILATGGTIAGSAESATDGSYSAGQVGIETMINAIPEVKKIANVTGEQISNVGSQDMSVDIWLTLANRVNDLLSKDDVDGIVITHGTDTQEETAYFMNLVVKSDKPVVTTGAMRSSTSISAEGPLNLYNAVAVAADPASKSRGVLVVMNDQIYGAQSVTKANTTVVNAFVSPVQGLVGVVSYGKLDFYRKPQSINTTRSEFSVKGLKELPRVDILYAYADMSPDLIDMSVKAGAKGIVIAGVGNGNMNAASLDAVKRATDKGVVVVRSTRVPTGYVIRNGEVSDDELGTIASDDLNAPKARVLLMLCLLKQRNLKDIQEIFYNY